PICSPTSAARCSGATRRTWSSIWKTCRRSATGPGRRDVSLKKITCVNTGSSTVKLAAYEGERRVASRDGGPGDGERLLAGLPPPDAIGHRVVHGGRRHAPARLDDAVVEQLRALTPLAPLHQPAALHAIDVARRRFPDVPQVACFDTAFHAS